ncbi:MAG: hypothetical protein AB7K68_16475 [Bacteriovoracia bacterium]
MKKRTQNLKIPGALLSLCLFSAHAFAAATSCADPQGLGEFTEKSKLQRDCSGDQSCAAVAGKLADLAIRYDKEAKAICGSINQALPSAAEITKGGNTNLKEIYSAVKSKNDELVKLNSQISKQAHTLIGPDIEKANTTAKAKSADPQMSGISGMLSQLREAKNKSSLEDTEFGRSKLKDLKSSLPTDISGQLQAPAIGTDLIKALASDKKNREAFSLNAQAGIDGATEREGELRTETGDKKSGSFLDSLANPSALMGLASAGMGLMSAMKKNSDVSTPGSPLTPEPIAPLAAANLGGGKDSSSSSQKVNLSTEKPAEIPAPSSPSFAGTGYTGPESDVSAKTAASSTNSNRPNSGEAGGGLGAPGGSGDSHREPGSAALANVPKLLDDGAGVYSGGGGGGGGLNFGGSSSSSSDTHTEDPLKETLHDMAAAVDDNAMEASAGNVQSGTEEVLEGENSEVLFVRVKSCIHRSVKKGLVISGLTAKIR